MANGLSGTEGSQPRNWQELMQSQQQQKDQMESKGQDLRLAQMLVRALDPSLPKGFRQLGLRQVAKTVGLDPEGKQAKEMVGLLGSLDPQSLEGLRRGVTEDLPNMQPGQVTEVTKGLLSGALPPEKMLSMIGDATRPPSVAGGGSSEEPSPSGDGFVPPMKLGGPREAPAELPLEPPKATAPGNKEAEGELSALLGIEQGRYTLSDLRNAGWDRIPDKEEDRRSMITKIKTMQDGTLNSLAMMNQIAGAIRGRPEVLDTPGGINYYAKWENLTSYVKSVWNVTDKVAPEVIGDSPQARELGNKMVGWVLDKSGISALNRTTEEIAQIRAKINAIIVPLSYQLARTEQGQGVLTNQDVTSVMESLGRSPSPEAFIAALETRSQNLYSKFKQSSKAETGRELLLAHLATEDTAQAIDAGGIVPKGLWEERGGRFSKVTGQTDKMPATPKERIARAEPTLEQREGAERAYALDQAKWAQEQRGIAREQQQMSRASAGREEERLQMAERGEQRAIEKDQRDFAARQADKQAERVQQAFTELGRAFRSQPVQVPAIPVAAQSAGAFQIAPIQRRAPPAIPGRRQGG